MDQTPALTLPSDTDARQELEVVRKFQQTVSQLLVEGHDYGKIEGTRDPTLLKPGAEKITKLLGVSDRYELIDRQENWDPHNPFFRYLIKCRLETADGRVVTEGMGECNSMESKYRWRWVYENEIPPHLNKDELVFRELRSKTGGKFKTYRIPNEDLFTQVNTFLKMAEKRALVDAALHAGRLSDVFTQDLEDMAEKPVPSKPQPPAGKVAKEMAKAKERAKEVEAEQGNPQFANVGELLSRCINDLGVSRSDVFNILAVKDAREISDLPAAYATVKEAVFGGSQDQVIEGQD